MPCYRVRGQTSYEWTLATEFHHAQGPGPSLASPVAVADGGAGWVWGAYTQVIAPGAVATPYRLCRFHPGSTTNSFYELAFYRGSAGSEVIAHVTMAIGWTATQYRYMYCDISSPVLAANSGVWARCRGSAGGGSVLVQLGYVPYPGMLCLRSSALNTHRDIQNHKDHADTVALIGVNPQQVTTGLGNWVLGGQQTLIAAGAVDAWFDVRWVSMHYSALTNCEYEIVLYTGGGATEIGRVRGNKVSLVNDVGSAYGWPISTPMLPPWSDVTVAVACNNNGGAARRFDVSLHYHVQR